MVTVTASCKKGRPRGKAPRGVVAKALVDVLELFGRPFDRAARR